MKIKLKIKDEDFNTFLTLLQTGLISFTQSLENDGYMQESYDVRKMYKDIYTQLESYMKLKDV